MAAIHDQHLLTPWRAQLLSAPASFRGIIFHVEQGARTSGRRTVVHEYPKRADALGPYAEDMGQHAQRFSFSGYLVYRPSNPVYEYTSQRVALIAALEREDAGRLFHPVFASGGLMVMVERYTVSESRERGGYSVFEMQFVQAGTPGHLLIGNDTRSRVTSTARDSEQQAAVQFTQLVARSILQIASTLG